MKAAIFAYSRRGCGTASRIAECLKNLYPGASVDIYASEKYAADASDNNVDKPVRTCGAEETQALIKPIQKPSRDFYGTLFRDCGAMIFVCSCGIAVRSIAPFVKSKLTDPAVIVTDELGKFTIPLLSGHIGGANDLARRISTFIGSTAVITTATDINGRFSVDSWAARQGYAISDMKAAKDVSAVILERDIPFASDFPVTGSLPDGLVLSEPRNGEANCCGDSGGRDCCGGRSGRDGRVCCGGRIGIYVTCGTGSPFDETLRIIPKIVHLGVGCRKGTSEKAVAEAVKKILSDNGVDFRSVKTINSIDIKSGEKGLLDFAGHSGIPIHFFTAAELNAAEGKFSSSDFVKKVTGTDCVCERAASAAVCRETGCAGPAKMLIKKSACGDVTVAAAVEHAEVHF